MRQGSIEIPAPAAQRRLRAVEDPGRIAFANIAIGRHRDAEIEAGGGELVELIRTCVYASLEMSFILKEGLPTQPGDLLLEGFQPGQDGRHGTIGLGRAFRSRNRSKPLYGRAQGGVTHSADRRSEASRPA